MAETPGICYLMTVSPQNVSSVLFHTVVNRCKYSGLLPGFVQFKRLDTCTVCPLLSCCNILPASCLLVLTNAVFACVISDSIRLTAGKKTTGPPSQKAGCVTVCSVAVQPAMGLVLSCSFTVFTGDSALLLLFGWPGEEVPCSNYHF